jgi:Carbohydrate esterase, sialic acid-specific acetylesterase
MTRRLCFAAFAFLIAASSSFADPAPKDMKLFLLIGQSNMAGRGKVEAQDLVVNPNIFMLAKDLKWVPAKDPLHFDKSAAGVGPGSEFAREVSKANPQMTIGLIPCAVGGTSLDQWKEGSPLYKKAVERAKEAMKQGTLAGILWHQGESDSDPALAATYEERLTKMMGALRKDLEAEKVPVVLGELSRGFKNNDAVNAQLAQAAKKIPLCALASTEGLEKALHFNSASYRKLGARYAAEYLKLAKP